MTTRELAEKIYENLYNPWDDEANVEEVERTIKEEPEVIINFLLERYMEVMP